MTLMLFNLVPLLYSFYGKRTPPDTGRGVGHWKTDGVNAPMDRKADCLTFSSLTVCRIVPDRPLVPHGMVAL